ncbi:MAG TPA: hypothetical protein DCR43_07975 [Bacteroidales bacterium]|nr:MAG: hypothetical protein A2X11_04905 [Bacteroidetes bacterium GWE2_42_24]OFY28441.1 MAG: hypothetical protein A2X09_13775 [Bacteroidetes bacterium GWF2_43_11]HAQ65771.1 hypothetical protein [Bacteroidales bacterium]HBZ65655.1 hypothetical protein [Bacteroidales bacterium]
MDVALYIARRYFVSRKNHNIINLISWISVAGIMTGSFAMIVVLSVFNGFEGLVSMLYNVFDPDLMVTAAQGKTFREDSARIAQLKAIDGVWYVSGVVEETALVRYANKQHVATLRGMGPEFQQHHPLDSMMIDGSMILSDSTHDYIVPGAGVAYQLGIDRRDEINPVILYLPRRGGNMVTPDQAFNSSPVFASGVFSVQQDFDTRYILTSLQFARSLMNYTNELTALEIRFKPGANTDKIRTETRNILGNGFRIKDRYEQQEMLYKIMKSEKWAVFLILSFIILISAFNVIGSLTMLILDKRKDITILEAMGAGAGLVRRIFFIEGMIISLGGAFIGVLLGLLVCLLQQQFGIIKLGNEGSTFVVSVYPVAMQFTDFVFTISIVGLIGVIASWIPARQISRRYRQIVEFTR